MKKIYQKPVTESHIIELQPLMDGNSIIINKGDGTVTNDNSTQFSRESGWDDDY